MNATVSQISSQRRAGEPSHYADDAIIYVPARGPRWRLRVRIDGQIRLHLDHAGEGAEASESGCSVRGRRRDGSDCMKKMTFTEIYAVSVGVHGSWGC